MWNDDYFNEEEAIHYLEILRNEHKTKKNKQKMVWREGEHIGSGSFGTVLWGYDIKNGKIMAVKRINVGGSAESQEVPFSKSKF